MAPFWGFYAGCCRKASMRVNGLHSQDTLGPLQSSFCGAWLFADQIVNLRPEGCEVTCGTDQRPEIGIRSYAWTGVPGRRFRRRLRAGIGGCLLLRPPVVT